MSSRKPKPVVLGRGELHVCEGPSRARTMLYLWDRERQQYVYFVDGRGFQRGTLIWQPDPQRTERAKLAKGKER